MLVFDMASLESYVNSRTAAGSTVTRDLRDLIVGGDENVLDGLLTKNVRCWKRRINAGETL